MYRLKAISPMVRIEAAPNVIIRAAESPHHLSLKTQVPVRKVVIQEGMCSDAVEMSANARLKMNTYVKLLSLESLWTT